VIGGTWQEGKCVVVGVRLISRYSGVAAGDIGESCTAIPRAPHVEGVHVDFVRVNRVHGKPLVEPVLREVAERLAASTVVKSGPVGALLPGRAAVGTAPQPKLAPLELAVDGLD